MITKLTPMQESKIPFYIDKWTKIGLEYNPIELDKAKEVLLPYLKMYLNIEPKLFIILDSPFACNIGINIVKAVFKNLKIDSQLYSQLDSQLDSQLYSQLDSQLRSLKLEYYLLGYFGTNGNIFSGYCSFYDYLISEVQKIDNMQGWEIFKKVHEYVHYMFIFKDIVFLSQKPKTLKFKGNVLHCENGPSVEYSDGYSIYNLNGVSVPKDLVMTAWDKLDSNIILKETNVEIRREIVRKIGIEKVCKDLGATILDKIGNYELLNLNLGDRSRPYLKMLNPSIGIYHIEGVPPDCDTVEKALNSRKPQAMKSIPVSKDGEDWYQQGDVCVWNKDAKSLKKYPKVLT